MSKVDDELTRRLQRAQRPLGPEELFEGIASRRRRRETIHRLQVCFLAVTVLLATAGGFLALRSVFDPDTQSLGSTTVNNGEIVFSRKGGDGHFHLFAVQPDGSGLRLITDQPTDDTQPAVSPDGQTVAFSVDPGDGRQLIATVSVDGGTVTWMPPSGSARDPTWSPDGTHIVYVATGIDSSWLEIISAQATRQGARTVSPDIYGGALEDPSWSPDGTQIAFATFATYDQFRGREASWDIATIDPGGSEMRPLIASENDERAPAWSPDGTRIAFMRPDPQGVGVWIADASGQDPKKIAVGVRFDYSLAWSPDGTTLLASQDGWIYRIPVEGKPLYGDPRLIQGLDPSWQPTSAATPAEPTVTPEPTPTVGLEAKGTDVGLGFNLCHAQRLRGIDFLGDGTSGTAWTGTRIKPDGTCPKPGDDRYGVAADITGDGSADLWSGGSIEHCGGCEPLKRSDVNGDGREELIVVLQYFSIMQYGIYTVIDTGGKPELVPFRVGEPGHPEHGFGSGKPFTFWVGGDAGLADWLYCDTLPVFWLTGTQTPIDPKPGDVTTVNETEVSLESDGIAHVLDRRTYTVPADQQPQLRFAGRDHSQPDCGLGVNETTSN
jgi:hypothetical protein